MPTHNTVYGSQAPDFIAGGSGNTTIYGERGDNRAARQRRWHQRRPDHPRDQLPEADVKREYVYQNADPLLCSQAPDAALQQPDLRQRLGQHRRRWPDDDPAGSDPFGNCGTPTVPQACPIYGEGTGGGGEDVTDRFGDYNNVIFGAKGIVTQDTQEATVGVVGGAATTQVTVATWCPTSRPVTRRWAA